MSVATALVTSNGHWSLIKVAGPLGTPVLEFPSEAQVAGPFWHEARWRATARAVTVAAGPPPESCSESIGVAAAHGCPPGTLSLRRTKLRGVAPDAAARPGERAWCAGDLLVAPSQAAVTRGENRAAVNDEGRKAVAERSRGFIDCDSEFSHEDSEVRRTRRPRGLGGGRRSLAASSLSLA